MKNIYKYISVLPLIVIQLSSAEVIDIKGTIKGSNSEPVENAQISLMKHPELVAYSTNDGTFSLQSGTPVRNHYQSPQNLNLTIQNNAHSARLCLQPDNNYSSITASLHSLDGRLLSKNDMVKKTTLYYFEIPYNHTGICVLKVKLNNTQITYPVVINNNSVSITGTSRVSGNTPSLYTATSNGIDDTLVVYKRGSRTHYIPVSYTSTDEINIDLTNSNQWIPEDRSSLTFERNMVKILAKDHDFEMGQPRDDLQADDQPVHTVAFTHDFWLDTTEVTQGEFDNLMKQYPKYSNGFTSAKGLGKNYPAYGVFWGDAVLFCNARSKRDGFDTVYSYSSITGSPGSKCELENVKSDLTKNGYHLPTEAQWEYACRGGTTTDYYWNKNLEDYRSEVPEDEISSFAIWQINSSDMGLGSPDFGTHEVASKKPNAYGLYDMTGNVSEYCHDWRADYTCDKAVDPSGPEQSEFNTTRGGNWGNDVIYLRSANRTFHGTGDYYYFYIGFRCARTIQ